MKKIISLFSLIVLFAVGCTTPGISAALPSQSAVIPSQPPEIIMVSVTPASISPGQSAVVTWSIANADNIIMVPGIGNVASSGTQEVKPAETTERDEIVRLLKALDGYFLCGGICNSEFV